MGSWPLLYGSIEREKHCVTGISEVSGSPQSVFVHLKSQKPMSLKHLVFDSSIFSGAVCYQESVGIIASVKIGSSKPCPIAGVAAAQVCTEWPSLLGAGSSSHLHTDSLDISC